VEQKQADNARRVDDAFAQVSRTPPVSLKVIHQTQIGGFIIPSPARTLIATPSTQRVDNGASRTTAAHGTSVKVDCQTHTNSFIPAATPPTQGVGNGQTVSFITAVLTPTNAASGAPPPSTPDAVSGPSAILVHPDHLRHRRLAPVIREAALGRSDKLKSLLPSLPSGRRAPSAHPLVLVLSYFCLQHGSSLPSSLHP